MVCLHSSTFHTDIHNRTWTHLCLFLQTDLQQRKNSRFSLEFIFCLQTHTLTLTHTHTHTLTLTLTLTLPPTPTEIKIREIKGSRYRRHPDSDGFPQGLELIQHHISICTSVTPVTSSHYPILQGEGWWLHHVCNNIGQVSMTSAISTLTQLVEV